MSSDAAPPVLEIAALDAFYGKSQVIFDLNLRVERGRPLPCSDATARARRPR